jgi:hypothetical protein
MDWQATPFRDNNWRFQLHAWRMLDPLLLAYEATNDDTYLLKTIEIVQDWYIHHIEQGQSGQFSWYDMSVGLRANKIVYLLELILHHRFAPEPTPLPMLLHLWHLHVDSLSEPTGLNPGNHGLFQLHGLLALVDLFPDYAVAARARAYGLAKLKEMIHSQLGDQGVHQENSPEYHLFICRTLEQMLAAPWYHGPEFAFAFELLETARENRKWMALPDGRTVPVGDSSYRRAASSVTRAPYSEPLSVRYVNRQLANGYGIVRSDWDAPPERSSMLFVMAAFSSGVHKHADDLSFFWFDHGQDILVDPGKYGYDSNAWRRYAVSTRAHNTVEIDGLSYPIKREYAYGSALRRVEPAGDLWLVEGAVDHRLHKVRHQRLVLLD